MNDISEGFAGFFPEAHAHFLQSFGCEPATALPTFDTSDEGFVDVAASLGFPRDAIQLALGNDDLKLSDELVENALMQSKERLRRCRKLGKRE